MTSPPSGCLVCGEELVYLLSAEKVRCHRCGARGTSAVRCPSGHYVCDGCHSARAKGVIERACSASASTDPVDLAMSLFEDPSLEMHGPEHHLLVPAALLAAWSNVRGEGHLRTARIAEARTRSEPILGGFCGHQGACGAGIGAGIFVAIATGSSPLKGAERGLSNRMTARALDVISRIGEARCCKRETLLAILSAARFAREHLGVDLPARGRRCAHSLRNRQCAKDACPFSPGEAAGA